jgi:hypothetical protein
MSSGAFRIAGGIVAFLALCLGAAPSAEGAKPRVDVLSPNILSRDPASGEDRQVTEIAGLPTSFVIDLSTAIEQRSQQKFRQTQGWSCLEALWLLGIPSARGLVQVQPSIVSSEDPPGWVMTLEVTVKTPAGRVRDFETVRRVYQMEPGQGTASDAEYMIELFQEDVDRVVDILNARRVKPCDFGLKVKGRTTINSEGVQWNATFEGESRLALNDGGSFSGGIPITYSWSPITVAGAGSCTITGANQDTYETTGDFDDNDGTLKITRLQAGGLRGMLTATCVIAGHSDSVSLPAPGGQSADAAAGSDVRIAFEHGAQSPIRVPSPEPGMVSEMTLELTQEGGGTGVALDGDAISRSIN